MRNRSVVGLVGLVILCGVAVFGSNTDFLIELFNVINPRTNNSVVGKPSVEDIKSQLRLPQRKSRKEPSSKTDQPENALWYVVFDFAKKTQTKADELSNGGQDGSLFGNYFVRQGPLSPEQDLVLKTTAFNYFEELSPIEQKAKQIIDEAKAEFRNQKNGSKTLPKPPAQLLELQKQKDEITARYRDVVRINFGEEAYKAFQIFLQSDFSEGAVHQKVVTPTVPDGFFYDGYSVILFDDSLQPPLITGFSQLYIYNFGEGYYYDPSLDSFFVNWSTQTLLDRGRGDGIGDFFPAEYFHPTFASLRGNQYCTLTDHYAVLYDGTFEIDEYLGSTGVCHVVAPLPPTPTPTPPPPTPTPTPPCDPLGALPCQTPTPTPTPSPVVTISPIDVVEKYGETTIKVTISNNAGGSTRLKIKTADGTTGEASFDFNLPETTIDGNVTDQEVKVHGVVQSSQKDNISIEATVNNNPTVVASRNFTVAVITQLYFQPFDPSGASDFAVNPGNGQSGSQQGDRIFPDRHSPSDNTIDRSLMKVAALVSPAGAGYRVYFGSYDLDDPSASGLPIDTTGADGNDNNGQVNNSRSGDFTIPTGYACDNHTTGTSTPFVSKVQCTTGADGTTTAVFKVTMQPGDNFTVAASLSEPYRNGIVVNNLNGNQLNNSLGEQIHISKLDNVYQTAGIRTRMLTIWRRLHIEVDSMDDVRENYAAGTITNSVTILRGRPDTLNLSVSGLDTDRFENGRVEIGTSLGALTVTGNVGGFVLVTNNTTNTISCSIGTNFNITNAGHTRTVAGTAVSNATLSPGQSGTIAVNSTPLIDNAFQNGTMALISTLTSLPVNSNSANSIDVTNNHTSTITIAAGSLFRLYDDDDFNDDNPTNLHGDDGEDVIEKSATFSLMRNSDGVAQNVYAAAYIQPNYDWARQANYNQGDVAFFLNRTQTTDELDAFLNGLRNSDGDERDDFWIAYLLLGYQSRTTDDNDRDAESSLGGATIAMGTANSPPTAPQPFPRGGDNTLFYMENCRDLDQANLVNMVPLEWEMGTAPHEIGHQMGLAGDEPGYGIMSTGETLIFVPTHINMLRVRVHSPGK
jgi:hypothetical protein